MQPTPNTCLVTHRGCLDGTGSALMFLWAGGRRDMILFKNPSGLILTPEEVPADADEVWYADCCPPDLTDPCCGLPFRVFDHHVSNQRKHGSDPRCTFDMARSGTSLMAQVLGLNPHGTWVGFNDLVTALESYDLGRFEHAGGVRLADIAASYSQEEMLDVLNGRPIWHLLNDVDLTARAEALSSVRRLYAESAARSARYAVLDGLRVGIASSPVYWKNEVSQRILESGQADMAIIIDPTGGMVSLRSMAGGPDCSIVAGKYGGGGHARAAGFKTSTATLLNEMFQEVFG